MKLHIVAGLATLMLLAGCVAPQPHNNYRRHQAPTPCGPVVAPIRYNRLIVVVNYNYAYNAKDPVAGRTWHKGDIIDYLNQLGRADGNTFAEPNGQPVNFYLTYTLSNDGQEHFTGSVSLSGWGQGNITTLYSGQYPYSDTAKLTSDLTDKAYAFIHGGWHDSRPNCPH